MLGTVKSSEFVDSYEWAPQGQPKKTYYKYKYEMESGEVFFASHTSQSNAFSAGAQAEFEITGQDNQGNNKGKISKQKEFNQKPKFDQKGIEIGHALNNGVQLAIAAGDTSMENIEKKARKILALATKMKSE